MKVVRRLSALLCLFCRCGSFPQFLVRGHHCARGKPTPMKIVGYFPRYGLYSNFFVKNLITSGSAPLLTHLDYAFANVVNNRCVSFDTYADYQAPVSAEKRRQRCEPIANGGFAGNFHQLQELKKLYPNLKIIMCIGGGSSNPNAFRTAALPANRQTFVKSCVNMYIKEILPRESVSPAFSMDSISTGSTPQLPRTATTSAACSMISGRLSMRFVRA